MVKLRYMKKIFGILVAMVLGMGVLTGVPVSAANGGGSGGGGNSCSSSFLGFYPWYNGLTDADCNIKTPSDSGDGKGLASFVWTIILNVMADLTLAIGYVMIGVTIWGGFYMMTSAGEPGKVEKARKILTAGVAGSIIGVLASVIAHVIISIL